MIKSIVFVLIGFTCSVALAGPSKKAVCEQKHKQYSRICKKTVNIAKMPGMPPSTLNYSYEGCGNKDMVTVTLLNVKADGDTPKYSSCTVWQNFKNGGVHKEVQSSLGTSLIVEILGDSLTTQVHTAEGHISCKADAQEANPINWWCGVMVHPSTQYKEVGPFDNYQLSPLYFGKKKLRDFLVPPAVTEKDQEDPGSNSL